MAAQKKNTKSRRTAPPPTPRRTAGSVAAGTLTLGAVAGLAVAALFGLRRQARRAPAPGEHVPTDLLGDTHPGANDRAPIDFRPDPTAPVAASERDAFRPALAGAQAPTLVAGQAADLRRLDAAPN